MFFGKRFSGYHGGPFSGLDILVLSIIKDYDKTYDGISGYEVIQEINKQFKDLWRASPGTIYPLLNRLAIKGYVNAQEIIDENNRQKKNYIITENGKNRLKEILGDNLESSMDALGEYLKKIVKTWKLPNDERIKRAMACFPYHCGPPIKDIDEDDYSLSNVNKLKSRINDLEESKENLSSRLNIIEERLTNYRDILNNLEDKRQKNTRIIEIVEDKEFENF